MKKSTSRKPSVRSLPRTKKRPVSKTGSRTPTADLKKLYRALQESEEKYRHFVENAADIIYRTDGEGKFVYVNPISTRILGYTEEEFLGKHYLEIFHPSFRNKARQYYATQFFTGQYSSYLEFPAISKDGREFWMGQNVQPLFGDGQIIGFQAVARDITERKMAEEEVRVLNAELERRVAERTMQFENTNKELEAFSYSVSHDLRSPLLTINSFSQFLTEHLADTLDDEGTRLLKVIRSSTQMMQNLITGMLMLSQSSKTELKSARVDMTELVEATYREVATPDVQKRIQCTVSPLPVAMGDKTLLRQVWSNLISNAIKFTLQRDVRTIDIGGRSEENRNVYFVKDSGAGFDMKEAGRLFGVFQRLHSEEQFEGTGVGLSIVRRVIHRHNGEVWAEGKVGEGATFYFSLPKE
ncbi:MAG: PAS domain S-box protein [Ignavibacteriales bacterium]|nr:PAS domain S-box protein [Ignavibacteriales bacterium]